MNLDESRYLGFILLVFIVLILLVGVFVLIGLRITWQRFYDRHRNRPAPERPDQPEVDPWEVSARRLTGDDEIAGPFDDDDEDFDEGIDPDEGEEWKRG